FGGGLPPFIGGIASDERGWLGYVDGLLGLRFGLHWPLARVATKHFQRKRHWWVGHGSFSRALRGSLLGLELGNEGVPKNNFLGQKARTAGAKLSAPPRWKISRNPFFRPAPAP